MAKLPGDSDNEAEDIFEPVDGAPTDDGDGTALQGADNADEDIEVVLAEADDDPPGDPEDPEALPAEAAAVDDDTSELEPEGDVDDLSEADRKNYSKDVQKRIGREIRLKRRAREEADQHAAAAHQAIVGRIAAERVALERSGQLTDVLIINVENEIREKQRDLRAAKEAGETDKEVALSGEISDLQGRKRELEGNKTKLEEATTAFEERAKTAAQPPAKANEMSPATKEWLGRNRWVANAQFKSEAVHLKILDHQLAQKMRPDDPRYFQELDKLIAQEIPGLRPKIQRLLTKPPANGARSAVAPGGRTAPGNTAAARTGGPRRVTLTREDLDAMREFKLDPKKPEDLKTWAREKADLARRTR